MFQFKKREEIFILINSECPKVPYLQNKKNTRTRKSPQILPEKKFHNKKNKFHHGAIITTTQESATTFKNQDMNCHLIYHQNWKNFFQKENPQ